MIIYSYDYFQSLVKCSCEQKKNNIKDLITLNNFDKAYCHYINHGLVKLIHITRVQIN